jgi:hypothetical protein
VLIGWTSLSNSLALLDPFSVFAIFTYEVSLLLCTNFLLPLMLTLSFTTYYWVKVVFQSKHLNKIKFSKKTKVIAFILAPALLIGTDIGSMYMAFVLSPVTNIEMYKG